MTPFLIALGVALLIAFVKSADASRPQYPKHTYDYGQNKRIKDYNKLKYPKV